MGDGLERSCIFLCGRWVRVTGQRECAEVEGKGGKGKEKQTKETTQNSFAHPFVACLRLLFLISPSPPFPIPPNGISLFLTFLSFLALLLAGFDKKKGVSSSQGM
jgi:hypothetical protein